MWYVLDWTQVPSALHDGLSNLWSSILEIVIASFTWKENAARRNKDYTNHIYIKRKYVLLAWFWTNLNGYHGFYIFEIVILFSKTQSSMLVPFLNTQCRSILLVSYCSQCITSTSEAKMISSRNMDNYRIFFVEWMRQ